MVEKARDTPPFPLDPPNAPHSRTLRQNVTYSITTDKKTEQENGRTLHTRARTRTSFSDVPEDHRNKRRAAFESGSAGQSQERRRPAGPEEAPGTPVVSDEPRQKLPTNAKAPAGRTQDEKQPRRETEGNQHGRR